MTRTRRFLRGIGAGYLNQAVLTVAGLFLTPFLLQTLGQAQFGLWLLATQLVVYMTLLDLGVIVILPRDLGLAVGRANGDVARSDVPGMVSRTLPVVLLQVIPVAIVAAAIVYFLPADWAPARNVLAVVLAVFVFTFPSRLLHAVLLGLQDTAYLGMVQLGAWSAGTALTVGLVIAGYNLDALAAGWSLTQIISAVAWLVRVRKQFPEALPRRVEAVRFGDVVSRITGGSWVSAGQVAQVLITGADILIIGKLLGPAHVVVYAVTGKLAAVFANQPQMLMAVAMPGLAELRTSSSPANLMRVAAALTQAMLILSGLAFCLVLAVNRAFVSIWVGDAQFGGAMLTLLVVVSMLLRHLNTSIVYTMFCLGYEKRITLTTLADGIVTVIAAVVLLRIRGIEGAALALIIGVALVSLPANIAAIHRASDFPLGPYLRPIARWAVRFAPVAVASGAIGVASISSSPVIVVGLAVAVSLGYALIMLPCLVSPPLAEYMPGWLTAVAKRREMARAGSNH